MFLSVVTPTHDPKYLPEIWECLERQTLQHRWEWVVAPTREAHRAMCAGPCDAFLKSPRVRVVPYPGLPGNVGAAKFWAFSMAVRANKKLPPHDHILVELDHDDLLLPEALENVHDAFNEDPDAGFVYSDAIDWSPTGAAVTYHHPERQRAWMLEGWSFSHHRTHLFQERPLLYPNWFAPSAAALASVHTAPNHLRAWRASAYLEAGCHDPSRKVCDDHDLLIRTYLATRMRQVPNPLYLYRVDGDNTWLKHQERIHAESEKLKAEHLHALVTREMTLRGLPMLDLGGGIDPAPAPWIPVDLPKHRGGHIDVEDLIGVPFLDEHGRVREGVRGIPCDLSSYPWPFADSSVGAFRAFDLLEHLPNRLDTMREIYRVLAPGGWLLSRTPSAAGPGAYQDPTHASLWVKESFRYYTEHELGRYLPGDGENPRFMAARLEEDRSADAPYVVADLVSLKGDDGSLPGRRRI